MVHLNTTKDYYAVLQVEPTDPIEVITKAYRRLAISTHPDRSTKPDATQAFQLACEYLL